MKTRIGRSVLVAVVVALALAAVVEPTVVIRCDDTSWWCLYLGLCSCGPLWP